jgi:hypothetical protein
MTRSQKATGKGELEEKRREFAFLKLDWQESLGEKKQMEYDNKPTYEEFQWIKCK